MKQFLLSVIVLALGACSVVNKHFKRGVASLGDGSTENDTTETNLFRLQRSLSKTASLNLVGQNGRVTLFYMDKEGLLNIVICEALSIIEDGQKCKPVKGSEAIKMPLNTFLSHIALMMRASYKELERMYLVDADSKEAIEIGVDKNQATDLDRFQRLQDFVERYNVESLSKSDRKFFFKMGKILEKEKNAQKKHEINLQEVKKYLSEGFADKLMAKTLYSIRKRIVDLRVKDVLYEKQGEQTMLHGVLEMFVYGRKTLKVINHEINEVSYALTDNYWYENSLKKVGNKKINKHVLNFEYIDTFEMYEKILSVFYERKVKYDFLQGMPFSMKKRIFDNSRACLSYVKNHAPKTQGFREKKDFICKKSGFDYYRRFAYEEGLERTAAACLENFDRYALENYYKPGCKRSFLSHKLNPSWDKYTLTDKDAVVSFLSVVDSDHRYRPPTKIEYLALTGVQGDVKFISTDDYDRLYGDVSHKGENVKGVENVYVRTKDKKILKIKKIDDEYVRSLEVEEFSTERKRGGSFILIREKRIK